jgi:hypothetical protein
MPSTEKTSPEQRNKALITSFIEEIFNEHNLSSIEKYFGKDSVEVVLRQVRAVKDLDSS